MTVKLTANTVLRNPETLEIVALAKGDEVPDWAEGMVGDHLLEESKPTKPAAKK